MYLLNAPMKKLNVPTKRYLYTYCMINSSHWKWLKIIKSKDELPLMHHTDYRWSYWLILLDSGQVMAYREAAMKFARH